MFVLHVKTVNWMAFSGTQEVGPLPTGAIALVGKYTDNARRSNWSGKSAWLEAIRFAITGAHRKRTDDACITYGADRMEVEIRMSTGLVVTRFRPRGGPTVLRVVDPVNLPGVVSEREAAEQHLARLIALPVDDFDNTSWFGQGDVQALCGKTSGVRREVFARWLELDLWDRMGKRAQLAARDARTALDVAKGATNGAPPKPTNEIEAALVDVEAERLAIDADRVAIAQRIEAMTERRSAAAKLAHCRNEADIAAKQVEAIKLQFAALRQPMDPARLAELEERKRAEQSACDAATKSVQEAKRLIVGRFDGQCPVTCETCPVAEDISTKRAAFVERERTATAEVNRANAVLEIVGAQVHSEHQAALTRTQLVGKMNVAVARLRDARKALDALDAVEEDRAEVDELFRKREENDARRNRNSQEQGQLIAEKRQAAAYVEREAHRAKQIETAEHEARIAQLVARALGGSGIAARIAAASLSGLEERANALLSGQGLSFTLTWERELADPAPACGECGHIFEKKSRAKECPACSTPRGRKKSDELDVLVDDGSGDVEDVRTKSGGAKVLVASAIRLAGGMMLRERRGSPLEVAFIDEPFGELDLENRDALARTFSGLLSSVGLEQAFVVSHDAQLLSGLPAKLVVTRDGNTSRIELER